MELIRRKTDYCLRALVALAGAEHPLRAEDLAGEVAVPVAFLHKAFSNLAHAGVLTAQRGPTGGFTLARPANKITLLDVIEVLQGPVAVSDCLTGERICERAQRCGVRSIWEKAQVDFVAALCRYTLADAASPRKRSRPTARQKGNRTARRRVT